MKYIDLDIIIENSDSQFLKKLPNWGIRLLKKVIHEDEINRILTKYESCQGMEFLEKIIDEFQIRLEYEGLENLPENGRCFFIANHPFGFLDSIILLKTVGEKYGDFKAIANEVFMLAPQIRPTIAAVNVFGTNPRMYIMELERIFAGELGVTLFPAGEVSRIKRWNIEDGDWHKSFISRSVKFKRDIVPFFFYGRNSVLFYTIYVFRKLLGIRLNLEMVLLTHEIFIKRKKTIRVKIGQPISWQKFDESKTHHEWAQYVKAEVYRFGRQH